MARTLTLKGGAGRPGPALQQSLLLVDGGPVSQQRLTTIFAEHGLVVGANDYASASSIESLRERRPDVVVVGLDSGRRSPIRTLRRVREALPEAGIVVVAPPTREHDVRLALRAGADAVVLEGDAERALAPTVSAVLAGQVCLPQALRGQAEKPALSHREKQVLRLVVAGATNRQIADELVLAESTVKSHLASAFSKLGVRSRAEAAAAVLDAEAEPGQRLTSSPPGGGRTTNGLGRFEGPHSKNRLHPPGVGRANRDAT